MNGILLGDFHHAITHLHLTTLLTSPIVFLLYISKTVRAIESNFSPLIQNLVIKILM